MYVVLPEVLTEHFLFGSLEFSDCVNAPPLTGKGTYNTGNRTPPCSSSGIKTKDREATASLGLFPFV